jgi:hypothetical protein
MTRRPEQVIQRAVIEHLQWRGAPKIFWCHIPLGGWRSPVEAKILKGLGTVAGAPDLLLVRAGQAYGLELKSEHGRLTPAQIATHEALRLAGAEVSVATGVDAAIARLAAWGFLR